MYFGMFGSIFLLSQFFQVVQGYSPFQAGLRTLPWTGMPIIVAPIAGILADRIGGRPILATGMALQAVALGWLAVVVTPTVAYEAMVVPFILAGIGMGLFFAPIANVVLSAVRPDQEGKASGATNTIREVGGVFGVAVLAAIFSANGDYATPAAYVAGMQPAIAVGAVVVGLGALAALVIPARAGARAVAASPSSPAGGIAAAGRRSRARLAVSNSVNPTRHGQGTRHTGRVPCSHAVHRPSRRRRRRHRSPRPPLAAPTRPRPAAPGRGSRGPRCCWSTVSREHSGRYEAVGDQLTGAGLDVTAYDHRGMGGSGGRRGDVERWSQFHDDLSERLNEVRAARWTAPGRPLCALVRRPHRSRLPAVGPTQAGPRGPDLAGARFQLARLEEDPRARPVPGRADATPSRTASTATPCRATRRSRRRPWTIRCA